MGVATRPVASFRTAEYEHLVAVLQQKREHAGLRHDELAKRLGKSRMYIYSIEQFRRRVDPEEVRLIAVALDLAPEGVFVEWLQRIAHAAKPKLR